MARRPVFTAADRRTTLFKLLAGVAIMSVSTACMPTAKKHLAQGRAPSPMIAPKPAKAPLTPKNPLHAATAYWGKAYQQKPNDPKAALNYAKNLKAMGSTDKAYRVLKQAVYTHPEDREIASEFGRIALARGETQLATNYLKMAERTDGKTDWRVLSALGTIHAKQGDHKKAQQYFISALQKNPTAPSLHNNLALSYAMSGKAGEAEKMLRKTVASGYDTPRVRQNLALVLGLQRKFTEAQQVASADLPKDRANSNMMYLRTMISERSLARLQKLQKSPAKAKARTQVASASKPAKAKTPTSAKTKAVASAPPLPKRKAVKTTKAVASAPPMPKRKVVAAASAPKQPAAAKPAKTKLSSKTLPLPWATDHKPTKPIVVQAKKGQQAVKAKPQQNATRPAPKSSKSGTPEKKEPSSSWTTTVAQAEGEVRKKPAKRRSEARLVFHSGD